MLNYINAVRRSLYYQQLLEDVPTESNREICQILQESVSRLSAQLTHDAKRKADEFISRLQRCLYCGNDWQQVYLGLNGEYYISATCNEECGERLMEESEEVFVD